MAFLQSPSLPLRHPSRRGALETCPRRLELPSQIVVASIKIVIRKRNRRSNNPNSTESLDDLKLKEPAERRKSKKKLTKGNENRDLEANAPGNQNSPSLPPVEAPSRIVYQVRSLVASGSHVRLVGPSCGGRIGAVMKGACDRAARRTLVLAPTRESVARAALESIAAYPASRVVQDGGMGVVRSDDNPVKTARRAQCATVVGTPRAIRWSFYKHEDGPDWLARVDLLILYDVQLLRDSGCFRELRYLVRAILGNKPQVVTIFNSSDPTAFEMLKPAVLPKQEVVLWVEETPRIVRDIAAIQSAYCVIPEKVGLTRILYQLIQETMQKTAEGQCKIVVFFPTGRITQMYAGFCSHLGLDVQEVHANKTPRHRARVIGAFREAERSVLFSSDMSARGAELDSVTHVFHVGIPRDRDQYEQRLRIGGEQVSNLVVLREYEVDAFLSGETGKVTQHSLLSIDELTGKDTETPKAPVVERSSGNYFVDVLEARVTNAAYFAWVAYYLSKSASLGWSKADLIRRAGDWMKLEVGVKSPPPFQRRTAKHLYLLGVEGVVIETVPAPAAKKPVHRQGKRNSKGRIRAAMEQVRASVKAKAKKDAQLERASSDS